MIQLKCKKIHVNDMAVQDIYVDIAHQVLNIKYITLRDHAAYIKIGNQLEYRFKTVSSGYQGA